MGYLDILLYNGIIQLGYYSGIHGICEMYLAIVILQNWMVTSLRVDPCWF